LDFNIKDRQISHWDYDLAGRPSTTTDAKAQVKTHSYHPDGQLAGITYTNSQFPTPNVSFTYDPIYGRLSQMTDGTGSTLYGYHPVNGVRVHIFTFSLQRSDASFRVSTWLGKFVSSIPERFII
jgi:YD repeat-containing protein